MARLAVVTCADLHAAWGRFLDGELGVSVAALLTKAVAEQGSQFIRDDVDKALAVVISLATPSKGLSVLTNCLSKHVHAVTRCLVLGHLCDLLPTLVNKGNTEASKDNDALLTALALLVADPSPETRYLAKKALSVLYAYY